eukprot:9460530-Lingulodinium_polyedra.AAC.1
MVLQTEGEAARREKITALLEKMYKAQEKEEAIEEEEKDHLDLRHLSFTADDFKGLAAMINHSESLTPER